MSIEIVNALDAARGKGIVHRDISLLVLIVFAIGAHAQDRLSCSNASLHGSYGLHATGTVPGGAPFAAVGRFTFNGAGNLTGKPFVRVAGNNIDPPEFTGTYSVSPHCIVTDTWGPPINSICDCR